MRACCLCGCVSRVFVPKRITPGGGGLARAPGDSMGAIGASGEGSDRAFLHGGLRAG